MLQSFSALRVDLPEKPSASNSYSTAIRVINTLFGFIFTYIDLPSLSSGFMSSSPCIDFKKKEVI